MELHVVPENNPELILAQVLRRNGGASQDAFSRFFERNDFRNGLDSTTILILLAV